jgi:hypothetical protein
MISGAVLADSSRSDRKSRDFTATFCALPTLTQRNKAMNTPSAHFQMRWGLVFLLDRFANACTDPYTYLQTALVVPNHFRNRLFQNSVWKAE